MTIKKRMTMIAEGKDVLDLPEGKKLYAIHIPASVELVIADSENDARAVCRSAAGDVLNNIFLLDPPTVERVTEWNQVPKDWRGAAPWGSGRANRETRELFGKTK
jgi:hypothetical protein